MKKFLNWLKITIAIIIFTGTINSLSCIVIETSDLIEETTDEVKTEQQKEEPAGKVEIISHQSYIENGYYYVVGEIQNNTRHKVSHIEIAATFFDSAGQVVVTTTNPAEMYSLHPGRKSQYEVNNLGEDQGTTGRIARYELEVLYVSE